MIYKMNNNFDENKEFVKRRITPEAKKPNAVPSNNFGQVRRPQGTAGQQRKIPPANGPYSNTQARPVAPRPQPMKKPVPPAKKAADKISQKVQSTPRVKEKKTPVSVGAFIKNALIFTSMLLALLMLGFSLILSGLHVAPEKTENSCTIYYGNSPKTPTEAVVVNDVLYVNLSEISEMCSFTVSGTKASLRYTAAKGEYIEFTIGSVSAKINGDIVNMQGAALIRENEDVWIPLNFVENYFSGILFERNEENNNLKISREILPESSDKDPIYAEVTFKVKGSQSLSGVAEDPYVGNYVELDFVNDLSEYEQYMNPENRDDYLILVNKTNHISSEDVPENLVSIVDVRRDGRKEQMVECAEKALEAMFIELRSAGFKDVSVTSGYRSYNKQVSLFSTYLQREMSNNPSLTEAQAKEIVLTYSAFPGTSEHHTGLCCDMHNLSSADVSFAKKEAYAWLKENCHKFGFVIRFPEDKTEITGYSFEPWHYRFVGRYHATRMKNLDMCLEEYVEHLKKGEE